MKQPIQAMMLFGAQVAANIGSVVKITPRYAVETDDDGKTIKDDDGVAVLKKDDNGQHIVLAERIGLLPRKSKDNPDMADATGLTGQGCIQPAVRIMKTITLGELLTEEQGKEVVRIMAASKDDTEMTQRLKVYLRQFRSELEAKGVNPEYLSYMIPFMSGREDAERCCDRLQNLPPIAHN